VEVDNDPGQSVSTQQKTQLHQQTVGDLEPPLEFLDLLFSADAIQNDIRLILDKDPLQTLFSFEWGRGKSLPPSPSPPPPKARASKGKFAKVKRDRKAENERRKKQKEEAVAAAAQEEQVKGEGEGEAQVNLRLGTMFRGPRTRRAAAAAEAHVEMLPPEDAATPTADAVSKRGLSAAKRRLSAVHGEDPPMVVDVGSQESFKMFHGGWILPPDQRRRGRPPPTERQVTVPRPKKKAKTDAGM
jgi:NuA3 HAT complex component NTO1